jgi:Putative lumazine-binding
MPSGRDSFRRNRVAPRGCFLPTQASNPQPCRQMPAPQLRHFPAGRFRIPIMKPNFERSIRRLFAGALIAGALVLSLDAATAEKQAVLAPVETLFAAMAKRDAAAIRAPLLPGGMMVLMRDGKPVQMTFDEFAERVGKPGTTKIEERIHDPLVRVDHDLAVVWAPFEFLVDGKVHHCGTDLFNLARVDGNWLITGIAYNSRTDCPAK